MNLFPIEYEEGEKEGQGRKGKPCPIRSARSYSDEHFKIINEAVQMMITAYYYLYGNDSEWTTHIMQFATSYWNSIGHTDDVVMGRTLPAKTHPNHPMTIWVRTGRQNFIWTATHALELCNERLRRPLLSGKSPDEHIYRPYIEWFYANPPPNDLFIKLNIQSTYTEWTNMPLCMPDEFKVDQEGNPLDVVQAYRRWVNHKHNTWHTLTSRNRKLRRKIDWRRVDSSKPNYIASEPPTELTFRFI